MSQINVDTIAPTTTGGAVNLKPCTFAMAQGSAQSLANNTQTTLTFDRTMHDSHSIVDLTNNKIVITAATAGIWFIQAQWTFDSTCADRRQCNIRVSPDKFGSSYLVVSEDNRNGDGTGVNPATVGSYLGLLESGDEVYVTAWHSYGSSRNTQPSTGTSQNYTFFRGFRIGQL